MTIENEDDTNEPNTNAEAGGTGGGEGDDDRMYSAAELKKAAAKRDKALKEAREYKERLTALQSRIEEIESEKERVAEEKERSSGELAKVNERLERKIEKLTEKLQGYEQAEQKRVAETRTDAFVDAIAKASGVKHKRKLRAYLLELKESEGVDASPETIDEDLTMDVVEKLKESYPEDFGARQSTAAPVPGNGVTTRATSPEDYVRKLAEKRGARNRAPAH